MQILQKKTQCLIGLAARLVSRWTMRRAGQNAWWPFNLCFFFGCTLPETNLASENGWLGRPIFRAYVSFREGNPTNLKLDHHVSHHSRSAAAPPQQQPRSWPKTYSESLPDSLWQPHNRSSLAHHGFEFWWCFGMVVCSRVRVLLLVRLYVLLFCPNYSDVNRRHPKLWPKIREHEWSCNTSQEVQPDVFHRSLRSKYQMNEVIC